MGVGGRGFLIPAVELRQEMENDVRLRELCWSYINICLLQVGQLVLANGQYSLRERLARWLLMCHDRLDTDDLPITHEFLSTVLGVRRPGITNELHVLEGIHAIRASRGNVRIVNRSILEDVADTTYGVPEKNMKTDNSYADGRCNAISHFCLARRRSGRLSILPAVYSG